MIDTKMYRDNPIKFVEEFYGFKLRMYQKIYLKILFKLNEVKHGNEFLYDYKK